jgi:hypothetical protein
LSGAAAAASCVNCGAALAGPYCAACGQKARGARLSLGHVARQAADALSPVDHGIVAALLALAPALVLGGVAVAITHGA